ncbi:MAG: PaaI family thioesterase [Alphaproteobacteria bacterium]|nr:MAG: PaaI family thioesterase [Alphaproteobacteria bacterium]
MVFEPKDPEYAERVRESLARQAALETLGIVLERLEPGAVDLIFPIEPGVTQQHGFVHAGVISTALDTACGYAALSLMAEGLEVLTVEFKVSFLAPARGDRIEARGRVIRPGRRLTFCEGAAYALEGKGETLVATMSATMMAVKAG